MTSPKQAASRRAFLGGSALGVVATGATVAGIDHLFATEKSELVKQPKEVRKATNLAIAGKDYGIAADGSTNDALAINAILMALAERGGGVLQLPPGKIAIGSTLDNRYSQVLVQGQGIDPIFNGVTSSSGTMILPMFAGVALKHRSPYGPTNPLLAGGGFVDMKVVGNQIATRLLEVDSIARGSYDLSLEDSVGSEAALFKCGRGFELSSSPSIQGMRCRLLVRQLDGAAAAKANCVVFAGSLDANVSGNYEVYINVVHANGDALVMSNADTNAINLGALRVFGTGRTVYSMGGKSDAPGVYARANIFLKLGGTGPIVVEGTDTPDVINPSSMSILFLDTENATPDPTIGKGAICPVYIRSSNGLGSGQAFLPTAIGSDPHIADQARKALAGEMLRLSGGTGLAIDTGSKSSSRTYLYMADTETFRILPFGQTAGPGFFTFNSNGQLDCGTIVPLSDNGANLGSVSARYANIYAHTGAITNSDARLKLLRDGRAISPDLTVSPLTVNEIAWANDLSRELGGYKFLETVQSKGLSSARLHIGLTVQRAIMLGRDRGLDPFAYAFICHDSWEEKAATPSLVDDNGVVLAPETDVKKAGDCYGIRYEELIAFLIAGQDARLAALEARFDRGLHLTP